MISEAASSSSSSVGARFSSLGLCKNSSPPGQWTLVDEYNIEKKDPYQEWTDSVTIRIQTLKHQLLQYFATLEQLDEEILLENRKLSFLNSRGTTPSGSGETTPTSSVTTQHNNKNKQQY